MNNLVNKFLKKKSIKDIEKSVEGELFEYPTKHATYFYGNGELIVSPADESQDETVYVVDTYGSKKVLVEY